MRITVKVGSNVLTRSDGSLDVTRMSALVDQIVCLRCAGVEVILVTSGAVAAGRSELAGHDTGRLDAVSARQLFSAVGQAKLIDRYLALFREYGVVCGQVLTTKENFATRHHYLNQQNCMEVMLRAGVVPVVNENDTVSVTELMFTDNDELSGLIAAMMGCERLVLLSNIDGVYTAHPSEPGARLIERIEPGEEPGVTISNRRSSMGRGGMGTKYRIARRLASEGVEVDIANGRRDGILPRIVLGEGEHVEAVGGDVVGGRGEAHQPEYGQGELEEERRGDGKGDAGQCESYDPLHGECPPALGADNVDKGAPEWLDDPGEVQPAGVEGDVGVGDAQALVHDDRDGHHGHVGETLREV